jgi:hypothetical protein
VLRVGMPRAPRLVAPGMAKNCSHDLGESRG